MSRRAKVLIGIALFSLFILAYTSVRKNIAITDLRQIEVKLLSAMRADDKPEYLVCLISMRTMSNKSIYLEKLNENSHLFIEGKEYRAGPRNRPKVRLAEAETMFELIFKIDSAKPENIVLRINGECLNNYTDNYEILLSESNNLNRPATIRPKGQ